MVGNKDGSEHGDAAAKTSDKENFGICGPSHLCFVDWRIPDHRRSVAASLVQGVYVLELDRQENRLDDKALAPKWWDFFNFHCVQMLVDQVDYSIFGAIFEYKSHNPNQYYHIPPQNLPPKYVIAFRGTLPKTDTRKRDFYLDIQLVLNGLTRNTRYQIALQTVQGIIANVGPKNIWLAGHSLGAAIALQVGKDMAKRGCYIESYLFNPPFASAPIEKLGNAQVKTGLRVASNVLTAGLSVALKGGRTRDNTSTTIMATDQDPFTTLRPWIPYLFVNPKDPISCEYVGYFEHQERMETSRIGRIEKIAAKSSIVSLVSGDGEALHLIPSAFVVKNMIIHMKDELKIAHGIHQWWDSHPNWQSKLYQFR